MVVSGADVDVVVVGVGGVVVVGVGGVVVVVVSGECRSAVGGVVAATKEFPEWDEAGPVGEATDRALLEGTSARTVTSVNPPKSADVLHARGRVGTGLSV